MTSNLRDKHARRMGNTIFILVVYIIFLDLKIKSMGTRKSDRVLATSDLLIAHASEIFACGSGVDVVFNNVVSKQIFLVLSICLRHILYYNFGVVLDLPRGLHLLEFYF